MSEPAPTDDSERLAREVDDTESESESAAAEAPGRPDEDADDGTDRQAPPDVDPRRETDGAGAGPEPIEDPARTAEEGEDGDD